MILPFWGSLHVTFLSGKVNVKAFYCKKKPKNKERPTPIPTNKDLLNTPQSLYQDARMLLDHTTDSDVTLGDRLVTYLLTIKEVFSRFTVDSSNAIFWLQFSLHCLFVLVSSVLTDVSKPLSGNLEGCVSWVWHIVEYLHIFCCKASTKISIY